MEEVVEEGGFKAPKSRDLKKKVITRVGPHGEMIEETVYVDDEGNIIRDEDVDYEFEEEIDEFGNKKIVKKPKIKKDK